MRNYFLFWSVLLLLPVRVVDPKPMPGMETEWMIIVAGEGKQRASTFEERRSSAGRKK
jgi:hypothetical protein